MTDQTVKNKRPIPKALAIVGTTSAGKTRLAVSLAGKVKAEIIGADSRQVYRGLDVGSGKDLSEYKRRGRFIKYHLIDVASPRRRFNLSRYQKLAAEAIEDILKRGKRPILVGGSGLYLQALVEGFNLPSGHLSNSRKAVLSRLTAAELYTALAGLKPDFARRLNNSDRHNARRLIRYLELIESGSQPGKSQGSPYDWLVIGVRVDEDVLRRRIKKRLLQRLEKEGLVEEVAGLRRSGLSWERLKSFGLEYKFVSRYLLAEIDYQQLVSKLETALWRFAKRQQTWFKRWERQGRRIIWVENKQAAERLAVAWFKRRS